MAQARKEEGVELTVEFDARIPTPDPFTYGFRALYFAEWYLLMAELQEHWFLAHCTLQTRMVVGNQSIEGQLIPFSLDWLCLCVAYLSTSPGFPLIQLKGCTLVEFAD